MSALGQEGTSSPVKRGRPSYNGGDNRHAEFFRVLAKVELNTYINFNAKI